GAADVVALKQVAEPERARVVAAVTRSPAGEVRRGVHARAPVRLVAEAEDVSHLVRGRDDHVLAVAAATEIDPALHVAALIPDERDALAGLDRAVVPDHEVRLRLVRDPLERDADVRVVPRLGAAVDGLPVRRRVVGDGSPGPARALDEVRPG